LWKKIRRRMMKDYRLTRKLVVGVGLDNNKSFLKKKATTSRVETIVRERAATELLKSQ
jgi:hypothetical protein